MADKFIDAQVVGPRRRDPLDRERLAAAALAKARAKHKGRNHWRNWERRQMASQARKDALATTATKKSRFERYVEQARAFWRGEREDHPEKP